MTTSEPGTPRERLQTLVAQCLERIEVEGEAAIDAVCAEHRDLAPALRQRLDALRALGLLPEPPERLPERIGPYRVLRLLGKGGMGVVFEAEQDSPRRRIAVKVLRGGLESRALAARFAHEAELLGRLQHPGIAQVFASGSARVGADLLPYFAMELVDGQPLTQVARPLAPRARLELLVKVCDAVHHAHQKGVIHRDLKPANILVDAALQPKVLDFGVARTIDPDWQWTLRTRAGQIVGTLSYMSPEQAAADPAAVDTRSDVYSLGVIVHETLTGELPYRVEGLRLAEALALIQRAEPTRLRAVDRTLRGDLETIVATAMAKEKEARYASVHDLAADLRRFLRDEPIVARPATTWYLLRKFARRNRALVGGVAGMALLLAAGLVGTSLGLLEARAAERTARQAETDARTRLLQADAVLQFQRRMLAAVRPDQDGRDVRMADVLDRAARELDGAYPGEPAVEALLRRTIGDTLRGLGLHAAAEQQLVRAVELTERTQGAAALDTLRCQDALAGVQILQGRLPEARALLDRALTQARQTFGEAADIVLELRGQLASWLRRSDRRAEALAEYRALAAALEPRCSPDDPRLLDMLHGQASALTAEGRHAEAVAIHESVRDRMLARHGPRHPRTIGALQALTAALQEAGRMADCRAVARSVLDTCREVLGPEHPDTLAAAHGLAVIDWVMGELEPAEQQFGAALAVARARLGPSHPVTLGLEAGHAQVLTQRGKLAEAEGELRDLVAALRAIHGDEHRETAAALNNLGMCLNRAGKKAEAATVYEELLATRRRTLPRGHADTLIVLHNLGTLHWSEKRYAQADACFRESVELGRESLAPDNYLLGILLHGLGKNSTRLERWEEAEQALVESHAWLERTLGAGAAPTRAVAADVGFLYRAWQRPEMAEAWERKSKQ